MGVKQVTIDGDTATVTLEQSPVAEEAVRKAKHYLDWVLDELNNDPTVNEPLIALIDAHTGQLEASNIIIQALNDLTANYDSHKHRKKADQQAHNANRQFIQVIFLAKILKEIS